MQHVRRCPTPERLVATHAAASDDGRNGGMLRHQQLTRAANEGVINSGAVKKAGQRFHVGLIAAGCKTVADGKNSQWCGAACGHKCKRKHCSNAVHLSSGSVRPGFE